MAKPIPIMKSAWMFTGILAILIGITSYLMFRLYTYSCNLVEADRQSFMRDTAKKADTLDNFLLERIGDSEVLIHNRSLNAYYQNKALGMAPEYGLAVALDEVRDVFENYRRSMRIDGVPVYKQIAFMDSAENRIIVSTACTKPGDCVQSEEVDTAIRSAPADFCHLVIFRDNHPQLVFTRPFQYKGSTRGTLLMVANLSVIEGEIQLKALQKPDVFTGLLDRDGTVIIGPEEAVGRKISDFLNIPAATLAQSDYVQTLDENHGDPHYHLVATRQLRDGRFQLVSVVRSQVDPRDYSLLWMVALAGLSLGTVTMLGIIFTGFRRQSRMYGQIEEARDTLELRVAERTTALANANRALRREMVERERVQGAFRREQLKFRTLVENSPFGMVMIEEDGIFTHVNPAFVELFGYDLNDAPNARAMLRLAFPDRTCRREVYARLKGGSEAAGVGRVPQVVFTVRTKDQTNKIVRFCPVRFDNGVQLITCEDITEQVRADEILREEKQKFQALVENAPYGMIMMAEDDTFTYVNPMFTKLFGYDLNDVPNGREWFRKAYPDPTHRHEVIATWLADLEEAGTGNARPRTFTVTTKSGEEKIIKFRPVRLETGFQVMTCADITEQTRALEALRKSEAHNRMLIEESPIGIGVVQDGVYVYISPAFKRIFLGDYDESDVLGHSVLEFVHPDDRELIAKRVADRIQGRDAPSNYEVRGIKKNGEEFQVHVWPRVIEYGGRPAIMAFLADVTEEKALRTQLLQAQKMEAVGTLTSGVAHEFNNLLQVASGYAALIRDAASEQDPIRADLEKIINACNRGAELVKRLHAFAGKIGRRMEPLNLNSELEESVGILANTLPRTIEIEIDLAPDLYTVEADASEITQLVMNLGLNASDAMPDGGKLTFKTQNVRFDTNGGGIEAGHYVLLKVADTGHGIDEKNLPHIYEPFFTTRGLANRSGLGLSVAHGIVERHSGHITCASAVGKGTTIRVYLPKMNTLDDIAQPPDVCKGYAVRGSVLVMDDDETVRYITKRMLDRAGYSVLTAADGEEAHTILESERGNISLAIVDLTPHMTDGPHGIEELSAAYPDVKVLVTDGHGGFDEEEQLIQERGGDFLRKPFSLTELLDRVNRLLVKEAGG